MEGGTELDRSALPQAEVTFSLPVASPSLGGAGAAGTWVRGRGTDCSACGSG